MESVDDMSERHVVQNQPMASKRRKFSIVTPLFNLDIPVNNVDNIDISIIDSSAEVQKLNELKSSYTPQAFTWCKCHILRSLYCKKDIFWHYDMCDKHKHIKCSDVSI